MLEEHRRQSVKTLISGRAPHPLCADRTGVRQAVSPRHAAGTGCVGRCAFDDRAIAAIAALVERRR
jgi:hypothetical protein